MAEPARAEPRYRAFLSYSHIDAAAITDRTNRPDSRLPPTNSQIVKSLATRERCTEDIQEGAIRLAYRRSFVRVSWNAILTCAA